MIDFWRDLPQQPLLQLALLTALLASVASGIVGSFVVVRRITYIAGGISHCILGGLGAAHYLAVVFGVQLYHPVLRRAVPLDPLIGALAAGLLAALVIGWVSLRARQREDTVIGAIWAIGMGAGVLFLHFTPGYNAELMSYLFGNINLVTAYDIWLLMALDVIVVTVSLLFFNQFLAVCFDEEFARLRGVSVEFWYLTLLCLTALTVVLLVSVVGIMLVIALLTLPVAIAGFFVRTLWQMMVLSVVLSIAITTAGLSLSYGFNLPTGATTIMIAGGLYLMAVAGSRFRRESVRAVPGTGT